MLAIHHHHKQQEHELESLKQNYKFNIEAVFDHESARDCFRKFLKDNLNEDPFMFYEMVEKYQKTRLDKNRFDMAVEIMNTFIVVSAKHELNLSMTIRNDILKNWKVIQELNEGKSAELMECPTDLFQKAQNVIFSELKQDNFPRFIDSEQFVKYLKKEARKSQFKGSPATLLDLLGSKKAMERSDSGLSHELTESGSLEDMSVVENKPSTIADNDRPLVDPHSVYISSKDYDIVNELISSLNDSSRWKVVEEKTGMKTLTSAHNYYLNPSDGALPLICFTGLAKGNHKELFNLIFSQHFEKKMSALQKRKLQLDYIKINPENGVDYPNSIIYSELDTHFPISKRDLVLAKTVIPDLYNPETDDFDRYSIIQKPCTHQDAPISKEFIRVSLFSAIIVEKKTNDTLRYYMFDFMDLKGKVPKKLLSGIARFAAKEFHKYLQKQFINPRDGRIKSPSADSPTEEELYSSEGMVELLHDHINYIREHILPKNTL
ncbi:regulator of G-protein signaling 8-like protein [Naegleria gruberi]|uniref:Regulator of G-protein signaling 8-like protein n=1 Tax=Naegleria gruberi TaxID=5762 RepID=D2VB07_NAEGR|nr:regulator of G-protein signaling 8-like protein [Naegleria gruberi]EFC46038.1 regulator of G-protein signaling 8-like protein [Naegleria gruberi]|eukprot:XP_002678782.1 regulator of G-protein signaling 8-like protein [Naegleria gruberi strain NEG-M]